MHPLTNESVYFIYFLPRVGIRRLPIQLAIARGIQTENPID